MNYKMGAIQVLLNKDCIPERFYSLLRYKDLLLNFSEMTRDEFLALSDNKLSEIGIEEHDIVCLLRRFLCMYDARSNKLKEIDLVAKSEDERAAFRELYLLPGVKATRAKLYFDAGYRTLRQIADSNADQIIDSCQKVIDADCANLKAPLPKEARTHIAVSKAFTLFKAK